MPEKIRKKWERRSLNTVGEAGDGAVDREKEFAAASSDVTASKETKERKES